VIENILLFIPFAVFLSLCLLRIGEHWVCLVPLIGFLSSLMIETLQWKTERGYFQIDDIIANTAGTVIGFGLYSMVRIFLRRIRR
jgi:glycopeptide antibiotics resistance protein